MNFTMGGIKPTEITDGLGGSTFNSTHLVRTYGLDKPANLSLNATNMALLFSATDRYADKPMLGMTEAKGNKTYLSSNQFTWKLRGHQREKLRVEDVIETGTRPGEQRQTFKVVLNKGYYKYPDVLIGEHNEYPVQVIGKPVQKGLSWVYTLKLQTDDPARYFPPSLLAVGKEFFKVSTSVADEMNQDYGTMQFNSVFELRSQTGNVAQELVMTDKALRVDKNGNTKDQLQHWRVPFLDSKGETYYNFMPMAEAELWNSIYEDIEWALVYGRRSVSISPQGYIQRTGPGLRQQLSDGHELIHNGNLTLSRLDEWLNSIYRGRKDATPASRRVVLSTGERGALMFDEMVSSDASSFLTLDTHFISGKDPRHLSFGAQFTHYRGKNGLDVTVMLNPANDNPDYCPQTHPVYTDTVIDSWRMDILDFGYTKEQGGAAIGNNIEMVCERLADYYFCDAGKWDKETGMPINDGSMGKAGGIGGYASYIEKSFGLLIRDITRCGTIRMRFDP